MARISIAAGVGLLVLACGERRVDFSTEVKPIINKHCISCHGGVKRNGGFSLLFREDALDTTESGKPAIIPGDPAHSEMIRRLTAADPEVRMPYQETPLNKDEIDILTRWIRQGAEWGDHWAYVAPTAPEVPAPADAEGWIRNEVDAFVLQNMKSKGLTPSPEASREVLVRRIFLDLTGLPPSPAQAEAFLSDTDPEAYEKLVDTLLAAPQFGEKWASWWLDMARYADTKGYERDPSRNIWKYRDWVINAFNTDKPFDEFTIEQLAGDLLPAPTDDQLIATAFHRNTMNNDEGGTEDEEFRVAAVIDRVNTTMEVWQSTTFACVQCHSHPYDPFRHEEYYRMMGFFNNTRDEDVTGEHPVLRSYEETDQAEVSKIVKWVRDNSTPDAAKDVERFLKTLEPKRHPHDCDEFVNGELIDTKWLGLRHGGSCRLKRIDLEGKPNMLISYWTGAEGTTMEVRANHPEGALLGRAALPSTGGKPKVIRMPVVPVKGPIDLYFRIYNASLPDNRSACAIEWFSFREDLPGKGTAAFASMNNTFMEIINRQVPGTPVLIENPASQSRATHVFERGNWLVPGEVVTPGTPAHFNPMPESEPDNRLGLARWLVDPQNPLTARTVVNRVWEQVFGSGLVETLEDFGTQGAVPAQPALLDWLSVKLMNDYDWRLKQLLREILRSATYRQDSRITPALREMDPTNKFLARGPRVRLSAEQIRDQALQVSGLLSPKMYGPSVMPYQPDGVWQTVYSNESWTLSEGEDRYRRGLYTFIKRTSPYPSYMMFDASSREVCVVKRIRTNTPLQALVTLNDPVYVEAARHFAASMEENGKDFSARVNYGYRKAMVRELSAAKKQTLQRLYDEALKNFNHDRAAAAALTQEKDAGAERAALIVVANAMLNLDEFLTKE